jgi:AAA15 family ATPase/GTPase
MTHASTEMMTNMHVMKIERFGPLKETTIIPSSVMYLTGAQASGKSVLAKLFYYFRMFKDEYMELLLNSSNVEWGKFGGNFKGEMRSKFIEMFGEARDIGSFRILYYYTSEDFAEVRSYEKENTYRFSVDFSMPLYSKLRAIFGKKRELTKNSELEGNTLNAVKRNETAYRKNIINELRKAFDDDAFIMLMPSGRGALALMPVMQAILTCDVKRTDFFKTRQPFTSQPNVIDAPTRNFLIEVKRMREKLLSNQFKEELREALEKASEVRLIAQLSESILNGWFVPDSNGYDDCIEVKGNRNAKVLMTHASSGQQEAVWLLNMMLVYAVEKRKCLLVIEEPETHLHPEAQYNLVKAICAFCNCTGSQVIITTHSTYVLSTYNNMALAGDCAKKPERIEELQRIIPRECWMDPDEFSAYAMKEGQLINIKRDEQVLADISELDAIAFVRDEEFRKLADLLWN